MTNEEAIAELRHWMKSDCYLEAPSNEACELAISALERDRWISVEERLPEKGLRVLCACRANIFCVMKWDGIDWHEIRHTFT